MNSRKNSVNILVPQNVCGRSKNTLCSERMKKIYFSASILIKKLLFGELQMMGYQIRVEPGHRTLADGLDDAVSLLLQSSLQSVLPHPSLVEVGDKSVHVCLCAVERPTRLLYLVRMYWTQAGVRPTSQRPPLRLFFLLTQFR